MRLAEIIFAHIPPATLERVAYDQGVLDEPQRTTLFKASGFSQMQVAEKTVEAYRENAPRLAYGLYKQVYESDWDAAELLYEHFNKNPEFHYDNHQASLVGRYPTLPTDELSDFLRSVKRHVCLIVSRKGDHGSVVRGTGFLIGPDLVLTCRHVLKAFASTDNIGMNGSQVELYFDFFHGDPVAELAPNLPEARRVALNSNWHIASCKDADQDGLVGTLTPEQASLIKESLDFILLRLDVPVGSQPLQKGGGRRRGWISLPADEVPRRLIRDEWIIIPQHPSGYSQRIDLGRFKTMDQTGTRIRYTTNAASGTSGAPCFNRNFMLVGVHNAYVGPPEAPLENQAIRFDYIAPAVRTYVENAKKPGSFTLRWSVARDNEPPQVILGRPILLNWLEESATINPATLAKRVYAARADVPGSGCTFSIDLLHAEIRGTRTPRAVYGERGQQLPATAEDFLLSLLRELGIGEEQLDANDKIPPRPTASSPGDVIVGEVDKLERWLSEELPNWLGDIIVKYSEKQIDIRPAAKKALDYYVQTNQEAPEDLVKNANSETPIYVRQNVWDYAYVVVDGLRASGYQGTGARTELKGEVRSLIAAVVKGKPESSLHPGLRRLRWMFLGYLPDFVSADAGADNGATLEILEPSKMGHSEVASIVDRIWDAFLPKKEIEPKAIGASARYIVRTADSKSNAVTRLSQLQKEANTFSLLVLEEIGG